MQLKTLSSCLLAICVLISPAFAGEGHARIDLRANAGELKITPSTNKKFKVNHAGWIKDEVVKKQYVTSDFLVSDEQWTQITMQVTPTEDCKMNISLRGRYSKTQKNWCYFDDVAIEGAKVKNAGFEETGGWHFPKSQQVLDESLAHSGKGAVLVWHDKAAYQSIQLKADVPVTLTVWVKYNTTEDKEPK